MITQSPGQIHFNHIMWQPVFQCMSRCKGCYVRESPSSAYSGPLKTDLLDLIFSSKEVRCDQLTISLDTMYTVPEELKNKLHTLWKSYQDKKDFYPELFISIHSWNDMQRWKTHLRMPTLERFLAPLTAVSLSNFPVLGNTCEELRAAAEATDTTIVYNSLAVEKKKESKQFEMGVRYSDITSVVMFKAPLGQTQKYSDMSEVIKTLDKITKEYPEARAEVDRCIFDAEKFVKKGTLCGAGITKAHVWPDGSVSSCPYDSYKKNRGGVFQKEYITLDELSQIRNRERTHPMHFCKIVDLHRKLNDVTEKSTNKTS